MPRTTLHGCRRVYVTIDGGDYEQLRFVAKAWKMSTEKVLDNIIKAAAGSVRRSNAAGRPTTPNTLYPEYQTAETPSPSRRSAT